MSSTPSTSRGEILLRVLPVLTFLTTVFSLSIYATNPATLERSAVAPGGVLSAETLKKDIEYKEGEILVKFRKSLDVRQSQNDQQVPSLDFDKDTLNSQNKNDFQLPAALSVIDQKYHLQMVEKIIKGAQEPEKELESFKKRLRKADPKRLELINEKEIKKIDLSRVYKITVDPKTDIQQMAKELSANPEVEYAEPNWNAELFSFIPNDPQYSRQWHLHNTGQKWRKEKPEQPGGKVDADIDAPEAWEKEKGNSATIISIVDTGIGRVPPSYATFHEDLNPNIWKNVDEVPSNGLDDDHNGYIDDTYGWDFFNSDNGVSDVEGHGTAVAGIAAAKGNNSLGISGVCPNCTIMATAMSGYIVEDKAVANLLYAVQNGARIINMSWGLLYGSSQLIEDTMTYAHAAGVTLVAASGNSNGDFIYEPAAFSHVISVAALDDSDKKASYSNFNSAMDIAAPAETLVTTATSTRQPRVCADLHDGDLDGYGYCAGTSSASPVIAGVAGLLLSADLSLTPDEVEYYLKKGADNIDAENPDYIGKLGAGRVNANNSLNLLKLLEVKNYNGPYNLPGGTHIYYVKVSNTSESSVSNASVIFPLPADFTYVSSQCLRNYLATNCSYTNGGFSLGTLAPKDTVELTIQTKIADSVTSDTSDCTPVTSTHRFTLSVQENGNKRVERTIGTCIETPLTVTPGQTNISATTNSLFNADFIVKNISSYHNLLASIRLQFTLSSNLSFAQTPPPTLICSWTTNPNECRSDAFQKVSDNTMVVSFYSLPAGQETRIRLANIQAFPITTGQAFISAMITAPSKSCLGESCLSHTTVVIATPATPTPTVSSDIVSINYRGAFSSKYGRNSLAYLAREVSTGLYKLPVWNETEKAWKYSADAVFSIKSESVTPAANYHPVIRWVFAQSQSFDSTKTYKGRIVGYFKRLSAEAGIGKNDPRTIYEVKKNGGVVWTGSAAVADPTRRLDYSLDLDFHVTDKIEFWAKANGDAAGDKTELDFTIVVR